MSKRATLATWPNRTSKDLPCEGELEAHVKYRGWFLLLSPVETRFSLCRNEAIVELETGGFEPACRGNHLVDFTGERL